MEKNVIIVTDEIDLRRIIREELHTKQKTTDQEKWNERLTRREAAKFLDVSYQTMYNYIQRGIIKEHGTAGKKFFFRDELMAAIKNENL